MRAKNRELQAMASLSNDPNFSVFMGFLDTWLKEETKECINAEEPKVNQGRAQVLTEIKATVEESRESVSKRVAVRAINSAQEGGANVF